ncbi:hypothetical protein [Tardiphaga sp. 862_B3_N1_1]|uniref:hypothetical protein n=1 Tax=Tardiphaga sp. 862_B3_N1_1 TaxID=3240763 RepID=UPI003F8B9CEB
MSNELTHQNQNMPVPFGPQSRAVGLPGSINAGAVAIEQERAIAEAQGKLVLAKRFPRDLNTAHSELMAACKSKAFAAVAFYSKPQGGQTISGPSIRMAEQIAQVYENFDYGHRELSRDDMKSEIEVYAWDMQKNNYTRRQKTVLHVRDTRDGPKKLRDQTDIDQKINNVASKEMRGLILAMMPKWLVEEAVQECRKTLAGNNDEPLDVRVRKMTQAFAKFGVSTDHLEKYLGHKLDAVLLDELVDLQGIFNSLRDGTPASEIFGQQQQEEASDQQAAASVADTAKAARASRSTGKASGAAAASPTPAPAPAAESQTKGPAAEKPAAEKPAASEQADPPAEKSKPEQKASKNASEQTQQQAPQPDPQDGAAPDSQDGAQQQDERDYF